MSSNRLWSNFGVSLLFIGRSVLFFIYATSIYQVELDCQVEKQSVIGGLFARLSLRSEQALLSRRSHDPHRARRYHTSGSGFPFSRRIETWPVAGLLSYPYRPALCPMHLSGQGTIRSEER